MTTGTELTIKEAVLEVLKHHAGRENAVVSNDLAEYVGLPRTRASQRRLQTIIRELRRAGEPILATCRAPYGYFYANTWAEVQDCMASLKSRLIEDALTRRDIKVGAGIYFENARRVRMF